MTQCDLNSNDDIPIDNLVAEVNIYLPKVSYSIAQAALMRSIMTVVDKAKLLSHTITQHYYGGVRGYPVEVPGCSTVLRVESVELLGSLVNFTMVKPDWVEIDSDQLISSETVMNGLVIMVYSGISKDSCDIPKEIYERYGDVIINKALSSLYGMFGEEWYSAEMVKFYGGIAKGGVNDIKQDTLEQEAPDGIPISSGGLIV